MTPTKRSAGLILGLLLLLPAPGWAHGGLPVSTRVQFRGPEIFVPTQYWGVFVGSESGPWRWICDEAINSYKLRDVYTGGDGSLYATNLSGLTLSHDGGCTWEQVTGDLALLDINSVVPDPVTPARAWATSSENGGPSALWRSEDAGRTWKQAFSPAGHAVRGVVVAPDGKTLHLVAVADAAPQQPSLYTSTDGGMTFAPLLIQPVPDGVPKERVAPLAVDDRDPQVVYLSFLGDPTQLLMRADARKGTFTELLRLDRAIFSATVDTARDRLLVVTGDGLYYADGAAAPVRSAALSRAQCATVHGSKLFACSWNYYPDMAAVALSTDGGVSFKRIFQYADTKGVLECPATTPVAMVCPGVWQTYAPQLGIDLGMTMTPGPMNQPSGSCRAAPGGGTPGAGAGALPAGLLVVLALCLRRRHGSWRSRAGWAMKRA